MSDADRVWLILANAWLRVPEYRALVERFGDAASIVRQSAATLRDAGLADNKADAIAAPNTAHIDLELDWLAGHGHHIVPCDSAAYPELLQQISAPPLLLYVNGDPGHLHMPAIAVVGSRNPTSGGARNAFDFSEHLARAGFHIISGLAEGIDTAAHRGALAANGATVALLGHGIDRVYPASNRQLAHDIAAAGAIASEYPLGTPPDKFHFPERNRLISGISFGTLVVEAARRSGSLITARLAAEQGREVFALPGSIHNPLARGCHELIRQGAKLVETAADIIGELAPVAGYVLQNTVESTTQQQPRDDEPREYVELRKYLSHDPISADELADHSGLTIDEVSSILLILELRGEVESLSGGRYALQT